MPSQRTPRLGAYRRRNYRRQLYEAAAQHQAEDQQQNNREAIASEYHTSLHQSAYNECQQCHEVTLGVDQGCNQCKKNPGTFTHLNNMDPGLEVPQCLMELTLAETMLIAQVNPIMTVYLLPRGGQFATRGHVISFPQDLQTFVNSLPRAVEDLDILIVTKARGERLPPKDFRVRRQKVLDALLWLKQHNRYYADIQIDPEMVDRLPVDDAIAFPDGHVIENTDATGSEPQGPMQQGPEEANAGIVPVDDESPVHTCCGSNINQPTEMATIRERLQWPRANPRPINEFETEGYIARAFPCLYPTGKADLTSPRETAVSTRDYFLHLMKYSSGRFRQDVRFIFYANNTCERWSALQTGRVYARRHHTEEALSIPQLRTILDEGDMSIPKRILRFSSSLRGTNQYWFARGEELTRMISQLGCAHVFFTFSFADTLWPDLHRHLPEGSNSKSAAVAANPWTVDEYCCYRFNAFFDKVMTPYLKIKDFWYRYEWQHRGSGHVHGMAWLEHEPLDRCTPDEIVAFADTVVSCCNPAAPDDTPVDANFFLETPVHPSAVDYNTVLDKLEDLKQLVNVLQRHRRCTPYCLKTKRDGSQYCRFEFPQPLVESTQVTMKPREVNHPDAGEVAIVAYKRNDSTVNKFNPHLLQTWRANMDISIVTDPQVCARYIAKYTAKGEPASESYVSIYKQMVTEDMAEEQTFTASVQKLLMKTVGNRDKSAQEVCHLLSDEPLFHCSRAFVTISFDGETVLEDVDGAGMAAILKYTKRSEAYEQKSYAEVMIDFTMRQSRGRVVFVRRSKSAVIRFTPQLNPDYDSPQYEQYCRQQLGLHKPFRRFTELTEGFAGPVEAYAAFNERRLQGPENDHAAEVARAARNLTDDDFAPRVRVRPDMFVMGLEDQEASQGTLPRQVAHDWTEETRDVPQETLDMAKTFLQTAIEAHHGAPQAQAIRNRQTEANLNVRQAEAYYFLSDHANTADSEPIHMIVSGTAGTGKTYLLNCLRQMLGERAMVAAPTGVAATHVNGQTLHSLLLISRLTSVTLLGGAALTGLQERWASIEYLFIDEMSMIGLAMLAAIDGRLKEARPMRGNQPFGGVSIVLLGDFGQLPPIGDSVLYTPAPGSGSEVLAGFALFQLFTRVIKLQRVVRQAGDQEFADILSRLRNGESTRADYDRLCTRVVGNCTEPDANFTKLFCNKAKVQEHNLNMLRSMRVDIASISARNSTRAAERYVADRAGGLENQVSICIGARVMLRANAWTKAGLVNGAVGTVLAIVYSAGQAPPDLPECIVVRFPDYTGPPFIQQWEHSVPICPIRRGWKDGIRSHSRTALPLTLSWALTIHKAQGLTLNTVCVDLGTKEISTGLSFVALSRVRRLNDLYLAPFAYSRISSLGRNPTMTIRKAFEGDQARREE